MIGTETKRYLYFQNGEDLWLKVMLSDIYYIETVKSTHYCEIVYKGGIGRLRADIRPLHEEFSSYLFRTKASTLVNLELVYKVDTKNRILYFQEEIYCTYAQRVAKELKDRLGLYNYRGMQGERR